MKTFRILSQKEVKALNATDLKAYQKELDAFIKEWKKLYPDGKRVTERVIKLGTSRTMVAGKPVYSIQLSTTDEDFRAQVPAGLLLRPAKNAVIIAKNAGFKNWTHLAVGAMPFSKPGTMTFTLNLNVEGEQWESRDGTTGVYKSTHFIQEEFVFEPSPAMAGNILEATKDAFSAGFRDLVNEEGEDDIVPVPATESTEAPDVDV